MLVDEFEAFAQGGQHAEREHVDLQNAQGVEIVLVPFDRRALLHRGVHDRDDFVEPVAGDDEAAAMLRQMARKAGKFAGQFERHRQSRIAGIEPEAARLRILDRPRAMAPGRARQDGDEIV